jgi:hypothetical protein
MINDDGNGDNGDQAIPRTAAPTKSARTSENATPMFPIRVLELFELMVFFDRRGFSHHLGPLL